MERIQGQSEQGKNALEGMFGSIIDGSMSATDTLMQLLAEIAKAQMMKGLMALPGMGATSGVLVGLLGSVGGGFTAWAASRTRRASFTAASTLRARRRSSVSGWATSTPCTSAPCAVTPVAGRGEYRRLHSVAGHKLWTYT